VRPDVGSIAEPKLVAIVTCKSSLFCVSDNLIKTYICEGINGVGQSRRQVSQIRMKFAITVGMGLGLVRRIQVQVIVHLRNEVQKQVNKYIQLNKERPT